MADSTSHQYQLAIQSGISDDMKEIRAFKGEMKRAIDAASVLAGAAVSGGGFIPPTPLKRANYDSRSNEYSVFRTFLLRSERDTNSLPMISSKLLDTNLYLSMIFLHGSPMSIWTTWREIPVSTLKLYRNHPKILRFWSIVT